MQVVTGRCGKGSLSAAQGEIIGPYSCRAFSPVMVEGWAQGADEESLCRQVTVLPVHRKHLGPYMQWYQQTWFTDFALPALVCAGVAWFGLLRQFSGKGRLLGTHRSAALAFSVVILMCAIAIGAGLLLPHLAKVPPAAAGFALGATAAPRRRQDGTAQPVVKFMTLGVAWLLERLEYRMRTDALNWSTGFLADFKESRQLRLFIHGLQQYLLGRQDHAAVIKSVKAQYESAEKAIDKALEVQTAVDVACDVQTPWAKREPNADEEFDCRSAFAEARTLCEHFVMLAYLHGRRSEHAGLEALRTQALHAGAHHGEVPPQKRRLSWLRSRR